MTKSKYYRICLDCARHSPKWLAASIQTQLIYDDDVMIKFDPKKPGAPRTQFKEMLGVGLTYKFK